MLNFVRNNQKIMQLLLFIFILPSFIFLGIEGYSKLDDSNGIIAKVAAEEITQTQFDEQFKQFTSQQPDKKQADNPQNRKMIIEQMINGLLMQQEINSLNINIDENQIIDYISKMESLKDAKNPDGSINAKLLQKILQQQGLTPEQFEQRIKLLLLNQYVAKNVADSSYIPLATQINIASGLLEKREIQVWNIVAKDLLPSIVSTQEQLKNFYAKNTKDFISNEAVDVEYILISKDTLPTIAPSAAQVLQYYNDNLTTQFQVQEKRRASHILIKVDNPAHKEDLKRTSQALLAQIRKDPTKFESLAKEKSQDVASAIKGGDLGYFSQGAMVKAFEDASNKLKVGEISEIVETEFGYHIIKLTEIVPSSVKTLDEVSIQIAENLKQQEQEKIFIKQIDDLSNAAIDSNNLQSIAKKLNLNVKNANQIYNYSNLTDEEKAAHIAQMNPDFTDPRVIQAIFDPEVKQQKRNTDVIQFGNHALIAHITKYHPKQQQTFEQSIDKVTQIYKQQEALKLAKQNGVAKLAAAQQGENLAWSEPQTLSRLDNKLPPILIQSIFANNYKTLPAYVGLPTDDGYILFKINKIQPSSANQNTLDLVKRFSDVYAKEELRALLSDMRSKYPVKIIKDVSVAKAKDTTQLNE